MMLDGMNGMRAALCGKVVLLTGGGGGIGFEAAKAFAYMGAAVVIAEIDAIKGTEVAQYLNAHFPDAGCEFYETDLSEEGQIRQLAEHLRAVYGSLDVLFHNAAMLPLGNVEEVPAEVWEQSYRVNFKAPLLLTQLFLPEMKRRNSGTIVFVPSSGAAPYMGAYEVFKTAQAELCATLAGELEGTGVCTYAIGPGLVKTCTAMRSIEVVAGRMGMTTDAFYRMNDSHILGAEEAGCGFALSVLSAERYRGQEIGSVQVLLDSGLLAQAPAPHSGGGSVPLPLVESILTVYQEQYAGWMERNIFERQWVLRDFKKTVGMSAEQFEQEFARLKRELDGKQEPDLSAYKRHFEKLKLYFEHQRQLLQGFEKNPDKLKENTDILSGWSNTLGLIIERL